MNHSKIEWLQTDGKAGYSVNPVKGYCPMACPYCYARRMYDRFHWDKTIRFDWSAANDLAKIKKPSRIFWGSTIELFGDWVDSEWMRLIFEAAKRYPQHTHIFLTKQPQNLRQYSPIPPNCWIGVSVDGTGNAPLGRMIYTGFDRTKATVKFISFEPLLASPRLDKRDLEDAGIDWLIIGAETGNRTRWDFAGKPPLEQVQGWAREIIRAADEAGIPCFTKDNLKLPANEQRREWPKAL